MRAVSVSPARFTIGSARFRAAGDGVGELVMEPGELGVQMPVLPSVGQAQRLRASDLREQRRHLVVFGTGSGKWSQQCLYLLCERRKMVVLDRRIPNQQVDVSQALEDHVKRIGLEPVEKLVQVVSQETPLRLRREFQEHP